jgi:glycosyltransferase involved in cell wall biosynthesis
MMAKKKAIIIRGNSLDRETRATKIIKTLTENNYDVHLLWWDRGLTVQRSERGEAGTQFSETVFNFKAPWGPKSLICLPFWWAFIFYNLLTKEWDIVHAIQVISLPPAIVAGKIKRKPVVYDMLDTYEDSILLPRVIRNFCVAVDKLFMRLADAVVLADEEQIQEVNGIPNSNVAVIYDSPETAHHIVYKQNNNNNKLTIFYAGLLDSRKKLNLDKMLEAVTEVDGVKLTIAGYGNLVPEIKRAALMQPDKIEYIGEIPHAEVLQRSADADLLFVLRDPILPVNKYICGSKILESMMCGTAIMVSEGTSTAKKVKKYDMGIVVNPRSVDEIKCALSDLIKNPDLCNYYGKNAANAHKTDYNWGTQGRNLLDLYERIL